jgi:hypothetical protein
MASTELPAASLLEGETKWVNPPEIFAIRPKGVARPVEEFWAGIETLLDAKLAAASPFVQNVASGTAPRESVLRFANDLCFLARDVPLIEGEIASRAALHGVNTVILLSYGATLAFGYNAFAPLTDLSQRFADALGTGAVEAPSRRAAIFLSCMRSLGLEWFEAGVAATSIDSQWATLARVLKEGLSKHYGLPPDALACFDAWAAFDGPRTSERPRLLQELAQSGYHQYVITHAIREISGVWRHMWDGWLSAPAEENT